jgi:hypothetical protein
LSAQLAELWCLWKETKILFSSDLDRAQSSQIWRTRVLLECKEQNILPHPNMSLDIEGKVEYVFPDCPRQNLGDMTASPEREEVTRDNLYTQGFGGWWAPQDFAFARVFTGHESVPFIFSTPWDGGVGGRLMRISELCPRRDKALVTDFLKNIDIIQCIMGEATRGWGGWDKTPDQVSPADLLGCPAVIFARYRDNCYILFLSMDDSTKSLMRVVVQGLLQTIYNIPLKWEPHTPPTTVWCEATLTIHAHGPSLRRKGVVGGGGTDVDYEWSKWVDRMSPNARFTLRSMLPSIALKSIWFAGSAFDLKANLKSIFLGIGCKGYPCGWWKPYMRRFWTKYGLTRLIPFITVDAWVAEGKGIGIAIS